MSIQCLVLAPLFFLFPVFSLSGSLKAAVNDPPIAADDGYSTAEDTALIAGGVWMSQAKPIDFFVQGFDIGDVDNDGTKDLVVTDPSNGQIVVYDSCYTLKYSIAFEELPRVVLISDLDQDAKNELVVGASPASGAYDVRDLGAGCDIRGHVYIGEVDTAGTFTTAWTSPPYYIRLATQFAAGDFNGNGKTELVLALTYYDRKLIAYEYDGATYADLFERPIYSGSDVNCLYAAGDLLIVGTACWSDYGLRVYRNYELIFSDLQDGITYVAAGDTDGDGALEIVRGLHGRCPQGVPTSFSIYEAPDYSIGFASPQLTQNPTYTLALAVGDLLLGGGEEIVMGTCYWAGPDYPENIWVYQYDGSTYREVWQEELSPTEVGHVYYAKLCDLDADGRNELLVATSYGLLVYSAGAASVLANDRDPDGDALTAVLVSGPTNGSLKLNPDGSFTYAPDLDFSGTDSFAYKANDGTADSNAGTVTIIVDAELSFSINEIACAPVGATVTWSAVPLRSYQCLRSSDLKSWSAVGGIVTAASDMSLSVFDPGCTALRRRFYKVAVLP